jgi:hypothetical protein
MLTMQTFLWNDEANTDEDVQASNLQHLREILKAVSAQNMGATSRAPRVQTERTNLYVQSVGKEQRSGKTSYKLEGIIKYVLPKRVDVEEGD